MESVGSLGVNKKYGLMAPWAVVFRPATLDWRLALPVALRRDWLGLRHQYDDVGGVAPTYDLEGNLLEIPGRMVLAYDAKNQMTFCSNANWRVWNTYDHLGRRIKKRTLTPGANGSTYTYTYLYDGWNMIAETINTGAPRHYLWGLDLSGTEQGAGGIGGLLGFKFGANWYIPVSDANGNITGYINSNSGGLTKQFEYDAYGNITYQNGGINIFRYRFSTKFQDTETGLYYYGRRFYDPIWGRWINRDPIEEDGGLNLYAFCENDGVNGVDLLGLWRKPKRDASKNWAKITAEEGDSFQTLATLLRLNFDERTKWLKFYGVFVDDRMIAKVGCTYEIPNTMVVYTSKSGFGDGVITFVTRLKRRAEADGDRYSSKGYHVVRKLWHSSEDVIVNLWNESGIAAISFAGHGSKHGFIADGGSGMAVKPSEVSPPYRLQAVRAYSCRSDNEFTPDFIRFGSTDVVAAWFQHVSINGTYVGYTGLANWLSQFWQRVSYNSDDIPD